MATAAAPPDTSHPSSSRRNHFVPDDTVAYTIYPDDPAGDNSDADRAFSSLHSLYLDVIGIVSPYLKDYVWQHEPFQLSVFPPFPREPTATCNLCGSRGILHLHGKTRYGDNVEDEWFIVFLLYEISRKIPSLSIRVWDTDGEFLLIEAAYLLPRWLNPENSDNRVFIRGGELHILGKQLFPLRSNPTLADALGALKRGGAETRASDAVQSALSRRISGYPERARTNMHRARVRVPLPVAQVLKRESCLISLAVEGFYDRDVDSMKHAARMERFLGSEGGGVDIVPISVRMSRAMYAQLVQQNFQAPRCYPMPSRDEGPVVFGEAELGMKIACGFEMMYQERRRAGEEGKGSTWDAFRESLKSSGYFRDLLPGSEEYNRLMREAEESYKGRGLFAHTRNILNAPVRCIDEILALPYSADDFKSADVPPSDDDSWLSSGENELNSAISERAKEMESFELERKKFLGKQRPTDVNSSQELNERNIGDMAKTMRSFVEKVSSFEGAELPENRDLKEVGFDVDRFMETFKLMQEPMAEEQSDSDVDLLECSSSSDMDFDECEDSEDANPLHGDGSDTFMESYSDALNKELEPTTLEKSFMHVRQHISQSCEGTSNAAEDMYENLSTVDVDANLVKNFLDSYWSQQGLPGPASNLLGTLGVKLPDNKNKENNKGK